MAKLPPIPHRQAAGDSTVQGPSTFSCMELRAAPICGSKIARSKPFLQLSDRDAMWARIDWMNNISANRLTTSSEPGAGSAISEASMFRVVYSARVCA
jgi:hypothetical protein